MQRSKVLAASVDKVAVPILVIHGSDDTVVPYDQSRAMVGALRRAGKPVEFVTLKGEDHWLSRSETRLQMLSAMVAFLEKNNPPGPASPPTTAASATPQAGEPSSAKVASAKPTSERTGAANPGAEMIASGGVSH